MRDEEKGKGEGQGGGKRVDSSYLQRAVAHECSPSMHHIRIGSRQRDIVDHHGWVAGIE